VEVSQKTGKPRTTPEVTAIEAEIERIQNLKPDEVRALWRETFKREVPKALTRGLLVRTICWHIQERAFGGHSSAILKLLASYAKGQHVEADRLRRLKPGTELVREYQGERHTVVITGDGYLWRGAVYQSLTAIARAITSSNWNGPRFFGLREEAKEKQAAEPSRAPKVRQPRPEVGEGLPPLPVRSREALAPAGQGVSWAPPTARAESSRRGKAGAHG
jgi:hypothetical protein